MLQYLLNIAIWFDQGVNVFLLGSPDETLSSRAYRADRDNKIFGRVFRPIIDTLFFWQKKHCHQAYLTEVNRKQLSKTFH